MSAFTEEICQQKIEKYLEAIDRVLLNQSYSISGKSYTRANLKELEEALQFWERRLARASRGGGVKIRQGINANA